MVALFGGTRNKKKSNQGFASSKYDPKKKRAAQSKGGSARVPKGFSMMSPERLMEVARLGNRRGRKTKMEKSRKIHGW